MDTWNTDRIYNWFGLALANESPDRKFYYDSSDNIFFDVIEIKNHYSIRNKETVSAQDTVLLFLKIEKLENNDASLIEIKKSRKTLRHLFDQTTSYENYMKREEEWNFVNDEIKIFLQQHSIDFIKSRLIE
ncbi:hypothetical protein [Cytophaga aurantiaca]|uniref:hypothetical protein n=1 Tax=Cytophaga aurantiaca TaxID=29530 RepID=UPI0003813652|nr:hypothetical protein [Cytophaga aurantiaca]